MNDYTEHVLSQLTDYSLGLLPEGKRHRVDAHLQMCESCRQELKIHRDLIRDIQQTIDSVTAPDPKRLEELRPDFSLAKRTKAAKQTVQTQVIVVAACLLLLLIGIGIQSELAQDAFMKRSPTVLSQTETRTELPTLTQVATMVPGEESGILDRSADTTKVKFAPKPVIVPIPIAPHQ